MREERHETRTEEEGNRETEVMIDTTKDEGGENEQSETGKRRE